MATETSGANLTGLRDPQRPFASLFGTVLVVLGLADYFGIVESDGRLFGVFAVSPAVNLVHVLTGLLGLFLGRYEGGGTLFNKLGGVIYLVASLAGTVAVLVGAERINWETNGLHLVLAVVVGAVGFLVGESSPR